MSMSEAATPRQDHTVTIIVNGRPKVVEKMVFTFQEIVRLAFPNAVFPSDFEYTVTFTRGPHDNHEGTLIEGGTVKVKEGMIFNVTETNKS
jgi:multiubiquitin